MDKKLVERIHSAVKSGTIPLELIEELGIEHDFGLDVQVKYRPLPIILRNTNRTFEHLQHYLSDLLYGRDLEPQSDFNLDEVYSLIDNNFRGEPGRAVYYKVLSCVAIREE